MYNCSIQKEYEAAKEKANQSAQETDRLLQLVQMTQEEQNAKEKQIMDLQAWVPAMLYTSKMINIVYFLAELWKIPKPNFVHKPSSNSNKQRFV